MIQDLDRDIATIRYNVLNLPDIIQFKNGNQIKNTYDASGQKLGTEYFTWQPGTNAPVVNTGDVLDLNYTPSTDQTGTIYIGNFEYNTLHGDVTLTTLSRIYNDEGYVQNTASPEYYYYRRDHLGDNREVWLANTSAVAQRTQYYPSGLPWAYQPGDNPGLQHRKYNGKEFVEMHGWDVSDLGWRGDYNAINMFTTRDRKAEEFPWQSPYSVANNNPVRYVDKNGDNAGDPESGGTPANQTEKKTTEAQSTVRQNVPEKIKPIKAPVALVQKNQAAVIAKGTKVNQGTLSKAPSNLEKTMNILSSPEDRAVAKNPVVQGAFVVAVAPPVTTLAANALVATESSVVLLHGVAVVEGIVKTNENLNIPPDAPYLFEIPSYQLIVDGTSNAIQLYREISQPNNNTGNNADKKKK